VIGSVADPRRPEACGVSGLATTALSVAVVQAIAAIARQLTGNTGTASAWEVTLCALAVGATFTALACFAGPVTATKVTALTCGALALSLALGRSSPAAAVALLVVGLAQTFAATRMAVALGPSLSGSFRRRPMLAVLWTTLAVLMVVQTSRLGTYMADPTADWWLTTRNELWARHMCMPAYIEAADLQRQGVVNVYDAAYYSALVRSAKPPLTVQHLDMFAGDPFQYPPPFLLAPLAALVVTNDFLAMRTVWYAVQLCGLVIVALLVASWVRGGNGTATGWLLPLLVISVPVMQALQYGQFHLAALLLAVGGMLAFERQRHALGGALLAAAVLSKIFPGILLLLLFVQKRWRAAAWTIGFAAGFTLLGLLVLGPRPFQAFLVYHLPRLANGQAFDFAAQWPEMRLPFMVVDNLAPTGLLMKARELGVDVPAWAAEMMRRGYDVLLLAVLFLAARGTGGSRRDAAVVWLALLNLAALEGYAAWGDYITLGSVWLLTLMTSEFRGSPVRAVALVVCWVLFVLVPGAQPMPNQPPVTVAVILAGTITLAVIGVNVWVIVKRSDMVPAAAALRP
jgi:hypothetical protein